MLYKNVEIFNAAELIHNDDGSVTWLRVPETVFQTMESKSANEVAHNVTGVELRFVIKGESVKLLMNASKDDDTGFCTFHVYYGGVQGGWEDHEVHKHITAEVQEFEIKRPKNMKNLEKMTAMSGWDWDPQVVRVIFDRGRVNLHGVIGDVELPKPSQCPRKTLLCYGSSITHGSNSIDMSHAWASVLGYNLNMDVRNLGMAGSCCMEPAMADYLAAEGERGKWDVAVLELGINVLGWEEEKICDRVDNILQQVAGRNPEKPIFVVSPFYYGGEDLRDSVTGQKWRRLIAQIIARRADPNVTYINGLEVLDHIRYMSADEIHPNIYGQQRIAEVLTQKLMQAL
ncbi:MAG: hypothetical protein J6Q53_03215 [Oscillospiraceae bacterium]|nr:hypothetical protein [Oscillospiraceae bacterium]